MTDALDRLLGGHGAGGVQRAAGTTYSIQAHATHTRAYDMADARLRKPDVAYATEEDAAHKLNGT